MRASLAGVLAVALLTPAVLRAWDAPTSAEEPKLSALAGTWRVDLRPAPDADPYYQSLVVSIGEGSVGGSFYDTTLGWDSPRQRVRVSRAPQEIIQ